MICRCGRGWQTCFAAIGLSREIDEELEAHIAEAIEQGRDPAEARRAFGGVLRHREESRDVRLVAWLDSLRADAVFGWRQLWKKKVTSAAAILSLGLGIGACTAAFRLIDALLLRPLPVASPERLYSVAFESPGAWDRVMSTYDSCSYPMFQRMRAAIKEAGRVDRSFHVQRLRRSDLRRGRGHGEGRCAVCLRVDVRHLRAAAGAGAAAHRRRRSQAGRPSLCGALVRLLEPPLRERSEGHRAHVSDGQRCFPDCRRGRGKIHGHGDRLGDGCLHTDGDEECPHAGQLEQLLASHAGAVEAGGCRRTDSGKVARHLSRAPGGEGGQFSESDETGSGALLPGDFVVRERGGGPLEHATRLPAGAGNPGPAGGAGAVDCVRERGQPDDRTGGGAGARDGAAGLDWRGALATGATGDDRKRVAGVPGRRRGRVIRVVERAGGGRHDQSADLRGAPGDSGGLARDGLWPGAGVRRDVPVRADSGA